MTSMRRNDVASTSFRRHVPTRFLRNQCQIITFLVLKSDIIENSRIELRGTVLPPPSNQIKVLFIITLPFNLVLLWFFPVSHRNWRKMWVDYWGAKGYVGPPLPPPPPPPSLSSYAYEGPWFTSIYEYGNDKGGISFTSDLSEWVNSGLTSQQQRGHTETGPRFKVSSERPEKRGICLAIPGLVVQRVIKHTTAACFDLRDTLPSLHLGYRFVRAVCNPWENL